LFDSLDMQKRTPSDCLAISKFKLLPIKSISEPDCYTGITDSFAKQHPGRSFLESCIICYY